MRQRRFPVAFAVLSSSQAHGGATALGGCGHRWNGIDRGRCRACHRTFADTDLFDRHRVDHDCTNRSSSA